MGRGYRRSKGGCSGRVRLRRRSERFVGGDDVAHGGGGVHGCDAEDAGGVHGHDRGVRRRGCGEDVQREDQVSLFYFRTWAIRFD